MSTKLKLKELRLENNYTQQYIEKVLNIKQNTNSQYESGQRQLPLDILVKLAEFYGVSTDYILGIKDI